MSRSVSSNHSCLNFLSLSSPTTTNTKTETILLIHTGYSSHRDFTFVTPHLLSSGYHLLVPDLPSHGRSTSSNIPFEPTDTIALLASLITREAHSGKAHVVGVSLGGFLGLYLAAQHPEVVLSVFVSGCGRNLTTSWGGGYLAALTFAIGFPTLVSGVVMLPHLMYDSLYGHLGLMVPEGLQADQRASAGYGVGFAMAKALVGENSTIGPDSLEKVRAKTLLVAAGSDDDVVGSTWMVGLLRRGNEASRAVRVEGMRHVWCLQDAELFARGVEAWLGEGRVLEEFEVL